MTYIWSVVGWLLALLFGLATISMLLVHNWLQAFLLLLIVALCLPPVNSYLHAHFDFTIHPFLRAVLILILLLLNVALLAMSNATTVYRSPEIEAEFTAIYDQKMADWPVPYEDVFVETQYGAVHVIVSGAQDAPPMLLLHASGVSSWSWKYNIETLSQYYRTYAIDLIGDAGMSEFTNLDHVLKSGRDQADLYAEITDKLEVDKAYVVGASEGGFIGSNYAIHYPERVEKLALLGPMGYAGATQSVIRIMLTTFFPLKPIQTSTFRWAFSDNPALAADFGEWFHLVMTGYRPTKVAPLPLSAEQRQRIQMPVLFVLGARDNLVGDPEAARLLVQDMPDVRVEVVDAGHLLAAEQPEQVNALIIDFLEAQ